MEEAAHPPLRLAKGERTMYVCTAPMDQACRLNMIVSLNYHVIGQDRYEVIVRPEEGYDHGYRKATNQEDMRCRG